jgi:hypothetical protein
MGVLRSSILIMSLTKFLSTGNLLNQPLSLTDFAGKNF